ncbi:MAG: hypothetical protein Q8O67_04960 [Deltaproteobacteria bacterium]|nr:hypothetical protein [Deltaproteobacteria bacterium]
MKLRLVASLVLLLIAVGLPVAAVSTKGPPWGFRGHQAVVLEVTGTVEGAASESRRQKSGHVDDKLDVVANLHLDTGDELRVARLSQARLRFENALITVGDGAKLVIGDRRLKLSRGLLQVETTAGTRPFEVELDNGAVIAVRSGGKTAQARIIADGKGGARGVVEEGSLEARTTSGEALSEPGKVLVIEGDHAQSIDKPTSLTVTATCSGGTRLNIVAPGQVQVFGGGALTYPDVTAGAPTGSAMVDVDPGTGEVGIFARDVAGNVARTTVSCEKKK